MTTLALLFAQANQFLKDRNWWQFHNPKNDAMDILVEVGELAEHFIMQESAPEFARSMVADEVADVLFGTLLFALIVSDNSSQASQLISNGMVTDEHSSYQQLQDLVLNKREDFNIAGLSTERQTVLSLLVQASQLGDLFIWNTAEQSTKRAQEKKDIIAQHVSSIVAHLILISSLMKIDLPTEYERKMKLNAIKYPIDSSSAEQYEKVKDMYRNR